VYEAVNEEVPARVPASARRVLDVGCGAGALGERLGARSERWVVGLTHDAEEAHIARRRLDAVIVADLESGLALRARAGEPRFDAVVLSHVLEHVREPALILRAVRELVDPRGVVVVAVPNVVNWRVRWQLARGRFRYTEGGILDRTHLRFFDRESALGLLPSAGFRVRSFDACGHLPGARLFGRRAGRRLSALALRWFPGLLAWQFVLVGSPEDAPDAAGTSSGGVSSRQ
jgi:SAM-dependent methyltransferase